MNDAQKVVFLHGLGETRDVWNAVIKQLPQTDYPTRSAGSVSESAIWVHTSSSDQQASGGFVLKTSKDMQSLGAVIALKIAVTHPGKVSSLFVSAPQAKPQNC